MKHRTFLAIGLPNDQQQLVANLQKKLTPFKLSVVWEKLEKIHLTLNFLGRLTDEQLRTVKSSIGQTTSGFREFTLQLSFLETLYQRHSETIIYLAPTGDVQILSQLQKSLSSTLNSLLLPQPSRFLPHFTIGHLKRTDPVSTKSFINVLSDFEFTSFPEFTVKNLTLYESFLSRTGSTYQKLTSFVLQSQTP